MNNPTSEELRRIFQYDPITGNFTYVVDAPPRGKAGQEAGWLHPTSGYRVVSIEGHQYKVHRLIWLWVTGELPPEDIDHIDRNRNNNSWSNLRLASRSENLRNQGMKFNNGSGFKGVTSRGNSHMARFRVNGKVINIGSFPTAKEAAEAYDREVIKHQGEFALTNKALGLL